MNWIKVSEGLPEKYKFVVVAFIKDEDLRPWNMAYLDDQNKWNTSVAVSIKDGYVTHWAYIEPPKE